MTWFPGEDENDEEELAQNIPENLEDLDFPDAEDWENLEEDIPDVEELAEDDLIYDAAPDGYEFAHHFDFREDAVNYVHDPGVPHGVLVVVLNDDGTADVFRTDS
jgi:hypothetical protein